MPKPSGKLGESESIMVQDSRNIDQSRENMDDATANNAKQRRTVRDFSRRNFVLLFLILLLIPTIYLFWYLSSVGSGSLVPAANLGLPPAGAESGGQMSFYGHVLKAGWKATISLVPYAVGQYLLGLQCEYDQNFLWASGSLLAIGILTLVQIFDVFLNPELGNSGKFFWTIVMAFFAALGVPVPQMIYWFRYMWTEVDRSVNSDAAASAPVSV